MAPSASSTAWMVSVTGHRPERLREAQGERIARQAARLFADLTRPLAEDRPTLRVVSALAEGADRVLARIALDAGHALHALLPFSRTDCLADFPHAASRGEFAALLARARQVTELPGDRGRPEAAYAACGHALVDRADLLCAVWDGAPAHGPGGTAEVVTEALRRGVPVVHLSTRADAWAALLWPPEPRAARASTLGAEALARLLNREAGP